MLLLTRGHLPFEVLDVRLQWLDLIVQTSLVLLVQLSVLGDLLSDHEDLLLELLTSSFTVSHHSLILSDILLQVIENLEFLVKGDQSVQFVLKLDFFFLKSQLELVMGTLIEHCLCESLGCHSGGDRAADGVLARASARFRALGRSSVSLHSFVLAF